MINHFYSLLKNGSSKLDITFRHECPLGLHYIGQKSGDAFRKYIHLPLRWVLMHKKEYFIRHRDVFIT